MELSPSQNSTVEAKQSKITNYFPVISYPNYCKQIHKASKIAELESTVNKLESDNKKLLKKVERLKSKNKKIVINKRDSLIQDPRFKIQDPRSKIQDPEIKLQENKLQSNSRSRKQTPVRISYFTGHGARVEKTGRG